MGESLWHDLDAWQVSIVTTAMGQASNYSTLKLHAVNTALVWDLREWQAWAKPAVAIMSFVEERQPGPHGDGDAHFTKRYRSAWIALMEGTQSDAKRDAKILLKRLETLARGLYKQGFTLLPDTSGERLVNMAIGHSELSAHRYQGSSDDLWMVMAGLAIDFETEV
jgi:hypothetical protein